MKCAGCWPNRCPVLIGFHQFLPIKESVSTHKKDVIDFIRLQLHNIMYSFQVHCTYTLLVCMLSPGGSPCWIRPAFKILFLERHRLWFSDVKDSEDPLGLIPDLTLDFFLAKSGRHSPFTIPHRHHCRVKAPAAVCYKNFNFIIPKFGKNKFHLL